jgi:hypothetical protein
MKAAQTQGECVIAAKSQYWFAAKQYGWGWGPPSSWQGWVVVAVYVGLFCLSLVSFKFNHWISREQHIWLVTLLTIGLLLICWLKGEPARWRWGKD